jgi:CheY-like chemotaxis protein
MKETNQTILIVDDEEHDVEFIKRAFTRAGVMNPVQAVPNGEEAVAYLSGVGRYADRAVCPFPSVIVTDLKMPRMGGLDLLRWLHGHYRLVPTVVLTSSSAQADVDTAFAHGAVGYMVKPVTLGELEKTIKTIADYWRLSLVPALPGAPSDS